MSQTLQLKRETASWWSANNPVLAVAEPGVESDTLRFKLGDGATEWNALAYQAGAFQPAEFNAGNSGTSLTVNWAANGMRQRVTLTGNASLAFTAPPGVGSVVLKLVQDATGSRTVTWPGSVTWVSGSPPVLSTAASATDFVGFYFDGTTYWGSYSATQGGVVQGIRAYVFASENNAGNTGTALTLNWNTASRQRVTMTGNCTFTFTAPTFAGVCSFQLKLIQDATGSRTATWPASVKWAGGSAPTLTTTATTGMDIITFYWDGTNYWGAALTGFV